MNKRLIKLLSILAVTTLIFSCTEKKNTVGFIPGVDPKIITFTSSDSIFGEFYSFEEELTNYYENSRMYLGNITSIDSDKQARLLIKSSALPDTVAEFIGDEPQLIFNIDIIHEMENLNTTNLMVKKITTSWNENDATWSSSADTLFWENPGGDFEDENLAQDVYIEGDSLYVTIPSDIVYDWIETDSLNFGIILFTDEIGMLKLKTSEFTDATSKLKFDYKSAEDDTVKTFNSHFSSDTFITTTDDEFVTFADRMILSNIQPIASILKINLTESLFIHDPGINDTLDFHRMTINRADLILHIKHSDNEYNELPYAGSMTVKAYNVDSETDSTFQDNQIQDFYCSTFTDSVQTDSFVVDVTPIIQGYVSGEVDNFGTLLRSTLRSKDFNYLEFITPNDDDATDAEKPKLKIIYTVPFLSDSE